MSLVRLDRAEPRFFPLIGSAILETAHFRCRVEAGDRVEFVTIERNTFLRAH